MGKGRAQAVGPSVPPVFIRGISQFLARGAHALTGNEPCCRFHPSCSRYAEEAFAQFGLWKALGLTLNRVFRCRPGGGSGYDPLPAE